MLALFLATALAFGSDTGRVGSNDASTVDLEPPGYTRLRPEMDFQEVCQVIGKPKTVHRSKFMVTYMWKGARDELGRVHTFFMSFDEDGRKISEGILVK